MLDHTTVRLAAATLALVTTSALLADDPVAMPVAETETPTDTTVDVDMTIEAPTSALEAAAAHVRGLDSFEVVVATIVRDAEGRRMSPTSRGRVAFDRTGEGVRFLAETWGGLESARLACDGTSVNIADPGRRAFETRPMPEDPARLLDEPEITARFGPAAIHVLGMVLEDGLAAFRQIGEARVVDLGPNRATLVPCRSMLDETGGEVRMAFAADGAPLPLAVAVLLPDGGVVELEFHDWAVGPIADADVQFAPPPADWQPMAALPRPACLPEPIEADGGDVATMPATAIAEVDPLAD